MVAVRTSGSNTCIRKQYAQRKKGFDAFMRRSRRRSRIATEAKYDAPARLNTRAQCEKELEHIVNWMKVGTPDPRAKRNKRRIYLDPNRGNAIVNAIRVSLQSKKDTEDLDLRRGDRELVRRVHDLERQLAELEDNALLRRSCRRATRWEERERISQRAVIGCQGSAALPVIA
jgi:hypothetical protein